MLRRFIGRIVAWLHAWINEGSHKPYVINNETQLCIMDLRNTGKIWVLINTRELLYYKDYELMVSGFIHEFYDTYPFYFVYSHRYIRKIDCENIAYLIYNKHIN